MQIVVDTETQTLKARATPQDPFIVHELHSPEAFRLLSDLWVKYGWANKYSYDFEWLGRRVIQLPEDLVRLQELVWQTKPTAIIETGIAHGGSTVFFASLLELLGNGVVVSVDIDIREHNRRALEEHGLRHRFRLIEGSSVDQSIVGQVRAQIGEAEHVMVMLDSNHSKSHVRQELELYSPLVTPGCYLVVADGIMPIVHDVPGGKAEWVDDNPVAAIEDFLSDHPEFERDPSFTRSGVTYFQQGYLRRK